MLQQQQQINFVKIHFQSTNFNVDEKSLARGCQSNTCLNRGVWPDVLSDNCEIGVIASERSDEFLGLKRVKVRPIDGLKIPICVFVGMIQLV
jgi:hypothetical protein